MRFHFQALHLCGESQCQCLHQHFKRVKEELSVWSEVSETLTPGPRTEIWSEHDKSRGNGQHCNTLTYQVTVIKKKKKKPFREHIGITRNGKVSSLRRRYREGNCCIFRTVAMSFNDLKVLSSNPTFKPFLFLTILFPHLW